MMRLLVGRWLSAALVLAVLAPFPVAAQTAKGVFYECDVTSRSRYDGWVSSKVGVVVLDSGKVVVSDKITLLYGLGTATATKTRDTEGELAISWKMAGGLKEDKYLLPDIEYQARIDKRTNRITLRGLLPHERLRFSGKGTCQRRTE